MTYMLYISTGSSHIDRTGIQVLNLEDSKFLFGDRGGEGRGEEDPGNKNKKVPDYLDQVVNKTRGY